MHTEEHHEHAETLTAKHRDFPAVSASVSEARNWAKKAYSAAGVKDETRLYNAALGVSELASNAVIHTNTKTFRVCVLSDGFIEVWDNSPKCPVQQCPSDEYEHGRGLAILETLGGFQVAKGEFGKCVRFRPPGVGGEVE